MKISTVAILALSVVAVVTSAGAAIDAQDGFVTRNEVCGAKGDLLEQEPLYRPYGGVLHVPPGLAREQREALAAAVRDREVASGGKARWLLVDDDPFVLGNGLPRDFSGIVFANCAPGDQGASGHWAFARPAGGLGFVWSAFAPADWPAYLGGALRKLEGVGVHVPN